MAYINFNPFDLTTIDREPEPKGYVASLPNLTNQAGKILSVNDEGTGLELSTGNENNSGGLPEGGLPNQLLQKISNEDGDANWGSQAFIRPAVTWADENQQAFSGGTIDVSLMPYNGSSNVAIGDTIIVNSNATLLDAGIWVINSIDEINDTAEVSRRSDSFIGSTFVTGEIIATNVGSIGDLPRDAKVVVVYNEEYNSVVASGQIGACFIELVNLSELIRYQNLTIKTLVVTEGATLPNGLSFNEGTLGNYTTSGFFTISSAFYQFLINHDGSLGIMTPSTNCFLVDATNNNVTIRLPNAGNNDGQTTNNTLFATIKRIDSSVNSVTVTVNTGQFLEGEEDGEILLDPLESIKLMSDGVSKWWQI